MASVMLVCLEISSSSVNCIVFLVLSYAKYKDLRAPKRKHLFTPPNLKALSHSLEKGNVKHRVGTLSFPDRMFLVTEQAFPL